MKIAVVDSQRLFASQRDAWLAGRLTEALREHGHLAELVLIPFSDAQTHAVVDQMLAVRLVHLKNVERVIGLGFPAYFLAHDHKIVWVLREFRQAYDLWGTPRQSLPNTPLGRTVRAAVLAAEHAYLSEARRIYARSASAVQRLSDYTGLSSNVLLPPLRDPDVFRCDAYGDYVLAIGPIRADRRQLLALEAIGLAQSATRLVIAGLPERADDLLAMRTRIVQLGIEDRVVLIGEQLPDLERARLLAGCRAVLCLGDPDGRLTQEACRSRKATIAFTNGPVVAELVSDHLTGRVVSSVADLARTIDELIDDPALAERYGGAALDRLHEAGISWEGVVGELIA